MSKYIEYINKADDLWYMQKNYKEAIKYYKLALIEKPMGRVRKKWVRENIRDLELLIKT